MAEIQFIVDKLNEPPFSKDLRLVRKQRVSVLIAILPVFEALCDGAAALMD